MSEPLEGEYMKDGEEGPDDESTDGNDQDDIIGPDEVRSPDDVQDDIIDTDFEEEYNEDDCVDPDGPPPTQSER